MARFFSGKVTKLEIKAEGHIEVAMTLTNGICKTIELSFSDAEWAEESYEIGDIMEWRLKKDGS